MTTSEMVAEQVAILRRIDELPKGSISYKTIRGNVQSYLQWSEGGKTRSRYLKASERDEVIAQVAERKRLKEMLAAFKEDEASHGGTASSTRTYNTSCLTGIALERFALLAKDWKRRSCYESLERYLCADPDGKVFILFGLRRTGKSTMLRQAVLRMTDEEHARTLYYRQCF